MLVVNIPAHSQNTDWSVNWGESFKKSPRTKIAKIVSADQNGFYTLRFSAIHLKNKKGRRLRNRSVVYPFLENYSNSGKKRYRTRLRAFTDGKRGAVFNDFFALKNRFVMFFTHYDKRAKKHQAMVNFFDKQGVIEPRCMVIDEVFSTNPQDPGYFDFRFAEDSSHVLVYHDEPFIQGEKDKFSLKVYDSNFDLEWQKKVTLPYKDENFAIDDHQVDHQGNAYLSGLYYENLANLLEKRNYRYVILMYTNKGNEVKEYSIKLKDRIINHLTFKVASNGDLVCAGFYAKDNISAIDGSFYLRIDGKTRQVIKQGVKDFEADFLQQFALNRSSNQGVQTPYNYDLGNFILRDDGGAVLLAEQYNVSAVLGSFNRPYGGQVSWVETLQYDYRDIIVVNINPDAQIDWAIKVPKSQQTVNDRGYYSSYMLSTVKDKMYLFYNDNPRNWNTLRNNRLATMQNTQKAAATVAVIDLAGNYSKKALFLPQRRLQTVTPPIMCKQVSSNTIIVLGEENNTYKFGKVVID
ncbi:MAG: hypothetical protein ACPGXL_06155 [Chitinophagales bacterium]